MQPALISQIGGWLRLLPRTQLLPTQPAPSANSTWRCYERFLRRVGVILDPFLLKFGRTERTEVLACFAAAIRDGRLHSRLPMTTGHGPMSGTIRATLDGVAQTFRLNKLESPIHDAAGRLDPLLALQLKKYADDDPGPTPQQAVPLEVIRKVRSWTRNEMDVAIGQLVVVAFFFAMRSCEYCDVGSGRLSTVVRTDDVRFRKNGETLTTTDRDRLRDADTVTITFRRQKNGYKGATVTQHRKDNSGQSDICPVQAMADLATRVRNYERRGRTKPKNQCDRDNKPGQNVSHFPPRRSSTNSEPQRPWRVKSGSGSAQIESAPTR